MKRRWFVSWLFYWFFLNPITAQPLTLTQLVVVPKLTMLAKPTYIDLEKRQQVGLTYKQNDFYIYFKAPGLPPPYGFRLQDSHVKYESQTANLFAFLTNVPSGNYDFSVWSIRQPGLAPARIQVRIEAPLWMQWWFLPMLFIYSMALVSVAFYLLYRYRLRQVLLLHAVRERIARDLHDDMGSYLSSISVLSQSVVNLVQKDPREARVIVSKIGETARQVMDSMSDIIWSVNPDNDSMAQIVARMRDVGADLLEGQAILFDLDIDEAMLTSYLPLEQRRDFFLIYKEALNNTAKYAHATHVWVRLEYRDTYLILTIQDDGIGFDPQQLVASNSLGGNGLKNMRKRAEKMGAILTITAKPGLGTTILMKILLA